LKTSIATTDMKTDTTIPQTAENCLELQEEASAQPWSDSQEGHGGRESDAGDDD